jgi:hypothetical protein
MQQQPRTVSVIVRGPDAANRLVGHSLAPRAHSPLRAVSYVGARLLRGYSVSVVNQRLISSLC